MTHIKKRGVRDFMMRNLSSHAVQERHSEGKSWMAGLQEDEVNEEY